MIRTPYPELLTDRTQQLAAFLEWNAGIQASMDDYHTHPFAACPHNGSCTRRYRRTGLR
jgi:hypothetical protein